MTTNEFKPTPKVKQPTSITISPKDMAIYNHVKLKLAYDKRSVEDMALSIISAKFKRTEKRFKTVGNSVAISVVLAVIGLVIKHLIK